MTNRNDKRALKILVLSPYYEPAYVYGGPAVSIPLLCRGLVKAGASVTVFTTNSNGDTVLPGIPANQMVSRDNVNVYYFSRFMRSSYYFSPNLFLAYLKRIHDFDLVQIHGVFSFLSLAGSLLAHLYRKPYFIMTHGMLMPWAYRYKNLKKVFYMKLFERNILSHAKAIIGTSALEVEAIQGFDFGVPVVELSNGVDFGQYANLPPRGQFRDQLNIPQEHVIVLILGRLHPVKRPDLVVEGFNLVAKKYAFLHLVFAGPDELNLSATLMSKARESGFENRVHFTGLLEPSQVKQVFSDSDIFLNTSESENFGMSVVEAMASGLPVIVSGQIGLARIVEASKGGLVCELNKESIADCLNSLLENREQLKALGLKGKEFAYELFGSVKVAQKFYELYRSMVEPSLENPDF